MGTWSFGSPLGEHQTSIMGIGVYVCCCMLLDPSVPQNRTLELKRRKEKKKFFYIFSANFRKLSQIPLAR